MERVDEGQIAQIVERVIGELKKEPTAPLGATPARAREPRVGEYGLFPDVDSAVKAAGEAFKVWGRTTLEQRHKVIANVRTVMRENAKVLAWEAYSETGLGRYEDKIEKNLLNANKTPGPEDLQPVAYTGDHGLTLIERAPFGVVASITPSTTPTALTSQ
jgi:acyl-CoA reductase-like NAD-dependent aldehyde dehydrogenase